jgi:hypothetical protein
MTNRVNKYISFIFFLAWGINFAHIVLAQEKIADGVIARPVVEYKSGELRDPFQSVATSEEKKVTPEGKVDLMQPGSDLGNLKVQGIIWGGRIPQAIINDKVLTVGDTIEGAEILSIDKKGITLSSSGALNNLTVSVGNPVTAETHVIKGRP